MGSRIFVVSDWRRTRCKAGPGGNGCAVFHAEGRCDHQRPFPILHTVVVRLDGGTVVSATCHQGRKAGGQPCEADEPDKRCRHVKMATEHALGGGKPDDPIETSIVFADSEVMPKCPNCRERWGVTALPDGRFSCRNPTCMREDAHGVEREFVFARGENRRPPPRRREWVIDERGR